MKDREISGKPRNLRYFECISFAMLFGLFSHGFVNSPQASQFAARNFKYKQNGEGREITNFLRLSGLSCKAVATKMTQM